MDQSSWECAILHGSCVEKYGTVGGLGWGGFDRGGRGALARPSRAKLGKFFAGVTPGSREEPGPRILRSLVSLLFSSPARGGDSWERMPASAESPAAATYCRHARSSTRAPKARHGLLLSPAYAERSLPGSSRLCLRPLRPRNRDILIPARRALRAPKCPRPRALHPAPNATIRPTPNLPPPCSPRA